MTVDKYAAIRLKNQMCFPLYVCSKEIVRRYKPYLDVLNLTYTQYIAMMVLWEKKEVTVTELGKALYLDSGTLTPLLKKLEQKGYVTRKRMESDERNVCISITDKGEALKDEAIKVPEQMQECIRMDSEEAETLQRMLHKLLAQFE
ncbi:MAG: MarR family transcriptional regulator [Clostridia bacterium]|nr:MarR family transcriptional regulator [Lachnospiraceae bacterium]NCC01121.1 MarR family transcriptional regulator [Clostridia bacterium]NCD03020.1 MarR family transcriptional regulator [Clostridia bacterium]